MERSSQTTNVDAVNQASKRSQAALASAKILFFCTAMGNVGWQRFQNSFYLDSGLNSKQIGTLKSIGLMLKIFGEPFWSMIADLTDEKAIFGLCMVMQVVTMEMLRLSKPLTYNFICFVKVLRTTTAPNNTLTNTASFKLTEGTNEGYGQQRMFGSVAWGVGAFLAGLLIDAFGMDALFYSTYFFNAVTLFFILFALPPSSQLAGRKRKGGMCNSSSSGSKSSGSSTFTITSTSGSKVGKNSSNVLQSLDDDDDDDETAELLEAAERLNNTSTSNGNGNSGLTLTLRSRSRSYSHDEGQPSHTVHNVRVSPYPQASATGSPPTHVSTARAKAAAAEAGMPARPYFFEVYLFLSHPTCRALLVNAFLYGVVMTVPETFLYISLEKDFEASRKFSGLMATWSVIGCVPLFWYSNYFINKYGHFHIIIVTECSCLVRLLAYALLLPSWSLSLYVLPIVQMIHGLNFALYWAAAVDAIHKLSPRELTTTSMAALNVAYATFGAAVGNLVWGYVYETCGGVTSVYNYSALLLIFTIAVFSGSGSLLRPSVFSASHADPGSGNGGEESGSSSTGVKNSSLQA